MLTGTDEKAYEEIVLYTAVVNEESVNGDHSMQRLRKRCLRVGKLRALHVFRRPRRYPNFG